MCRKRVKQTDGWLVDGTAKEEKDLVGRKKSGRTVRGRLETSLNGFSIFYR